MPPQVSERAMTGKERQTLEYIARGGPDRRFIIFMVLFAGFGSAAILWVMLLVAWLAVAWAVWIAFDAEIGLHSVAADWMIPLTGFAAATCIFGLFIFFTRSRKDGGASLKADIEADRVIEEEYELTAAKRMQEREHGGLIYFLRTVDDEVLVLYDPESQQLGVLEKDPLNSSFRPCNRLIMVRAPQTRYVIDKVFSGEPLDPGAPLDLTASPKRWPEDEEFCDVAWEDLEATYCR